MPIMLKTLPEIAKMRNAGLILREVHDTIAPFVLPGVSTMELEEAACRKIALLGATAAFKGYHGFPAALCTSVNNQVVHGIPSEDVVLHHGDILSIDCGVVVDGFYADAAVTYAIGKVSAQTKKLLQVTEESLELAIQAAVPGGRLGDISFAVQRHCEAAGFGVVREFVGHGIGKSMHEDPQLPNYGPPGKGPRLRPGMVLAIEPMINAGGPEVKVLKDGWTAVTLDGSYSAHFEHTVAITKDGPYVLTR